MPDYSYDPTQDYPERFAATPPPARLVRAAIAEALALLLELDLDPLSLKVEGSLVTSPTVKVELRSKADLVRWAAAEKVKVEHRQLTGLKIAARHEFSAVYDKPGRLMLAQAVIYPHSPEWSTLEGQATAEADRVERLWPQSD